MSKSKCRLIGSRKLISFQSKHSRALDTQCEMKREGHRAGLVDTKLDFLFVSFDQRTALSTSSNGQVSKNLAYSLQLYSLISLIMEF